MKAELEIAMPRSYGAPPGVVGSEAGERLGDVQRSDEVRRPGRREAAGLPRRGRDARVGAERDAARVLGDREERRVEHDAQAVADRPGDLDVAERRFDRSRDRRVARRVDRVQEVLEGRLHEVLDVADEEIDEELDDAAEDAFAVVAVAEPAEDHVRAADLGDVDVLGGAGAAG